MQSFLFFKAYSTDFSLKSMRLLHVKNLSNYGFHIQVQSVLKVTGAFWMQGGKGKSSEQRQKQAGLVSTFAVSPYHGKD